MASWKKRSAGFSRPVCAVLERLDAPLIVDAPLALSSEGLVLSGPADLEDREPALFADPAPATTDPAPAPPALPEQLPPQDDPLSPVGDPPPGKGRDRTASMSSCCITYSVSVINLSGVDEAAPTVKGKFRFSATASCSSGAPSSITVGYNRNGSTATANVDYNGEITSDSVTIPLVNGSGTKDKEFSVIDDAIDEVPEFVKVNVPQTATIIPLHPYGSAQGQVLDNDMEWRAADAIEGYISTSAGDDPAVPINHTLGLSVTAWDRDEYKEDGYWRDYWDDVTSGDTASDHHVSWSASNGKFIQNNVEVDTAYGTGATYLAPDYAEGQLERTVTITATVDDFNRGADVEGFNDNALQLQEGVKVWQIKVTVKQNGDISPRYDGADIPDGYGGGRLGWIVPNTPLDATGYHGATEVMGTVPIPGRPTGWNWAQD